MRRFPLFIAACSSLLLFPAPPSAAGPVLADLDGDGQLDTATVGDWDDDGVRETADVQAAVKALTDSSMKTVRVTPGVYVAPTQTPPGPGLIQLRSGTTLACDPGARLEGLPAPPIGSDTDTSTVTNSDHVAGNSDIKILGCEITGGMPSSYDSSGWRGLVRMGVFFHTVTRGRVEASFVHDTLHTCLYAKNSRDIVFANNQLDDCGGYRDLDRLGKPAVYFYATTGGTVENVTVMGNVVRRSGANALNLRRNTIADTIRNVTFSGNWVEDTADATDCVTVRGSDQVRIQDQTCLRTGPVGTGPNATTYYNNAIPHVDSVRNLTIERLTMRKVDGTGVAIRPYVDGITLRDVRVEETSGINPCVAIHTPFRRLWIERLTAERCGGAGILQRGCDSCGQPRDGLVLLDITVTDPDVWRPLDSTRAAGIAFTGPVHGLLLDGADISGASGSGIDFGPSRVVSSVVRDVSVDGVPSGFLGRRTAASLPACSGANLEKWAIVSDAASATSCTGGGSREVLCRCTDFSWRITAYPSGRYGVHVHNGASDGVRLESVETANFGASYGIRVDGSPNAVQIVGVHASDDSPATPAAMQGAVDASAAAVGLVVSGATCSGTNPATPCVRKSNVYPVPEDPDDDGIATVCDYGCSDGIDNDGDLKIDFPLDPDCQYASDRYEKAGCGTGAELALIAPALVLGRRRLRLRLARERGTVDLAGRRLG